MDYYDFQVHIRMCLVSENIENEFRMTLAGYGPQKKASFDEIMHSVTKGSGPKGVTISKEFDPASGQFKEHKSAAPPKVYQRFDPKSGKLLGG